ncbi:MAG: hypothetical protein JZD41_07050 [Thermoproteus sp.]|nr:hypothetical protein [Thermoproteus sp.]
MSKDAVMWFTLVAVAALVEFVLAPIVLYGPFPSATDILIDLGDFRSWKIIALIVMYLVSSVLFILSAFKLRRVFSSLA